LRVASSGFWANPETTIRTSSIKPEMNLIATPSSY
jgi:hypothetical protein